MTRAFPILVLSSLALGACVNSTQMLATWKDPSAQPLAPRRTVAVFMSKEAGIRRMVEDKLAAKLPGGVASYKILSDSELTTVEDTRAKLVDAGFDAAVVMRLIGTTAEVKEVGYQRDFAGYWGYWGTAYDPAYYSTETLYSVESTLYSLQSGKMVWMGRSQTTDPKNSNKLADYSVNFAIKNMEKSGVLR